MESVFALFARALVPACVQLARQMADIVRKYGGGGTANNTGTDPGPPIPGPSGGSVCTCGARQAPTIPQAAYDVYNIEGSQPVSKASV